MDNISINGKNAEIRLKGKLYPLESFYSAAYVMLPKAYIILDGDPEKDIVVKITTKDDTDPEDIAKKFLDELINYSDYLERAKSTQKIKELLLQRALFSNEIARMNDDKDFEELMDDLDKDIDDPEGIAIPWEKECNSQSTTTKHEK